MVLKGTEIPARCVVGARSLTNRKYDVPEYSLLSGVPAELKKAGVWQDIDDPMTNELQ